MPVFQITINEKGGQQRSLEFDKNEVLIGRVQGNDVVLPKGNISKRHSRIVVKDGKFIIIDMQSTNGTYVNGKKITTPQVIKSTDKIYIGDFTLQLASQNGVAEERPPGRRRDDEIDLLDDGGPEPVDATAAKSPGLIDENFDEAFDGGIDEEDDVLSAKPEREKDEFELELGPEPDPEPEPEPEPEPDFEPELEVTPPPIALDPPKPMKPAPKKSAAGPRSGQSRLKPAAGRLKPVRKDAPSRPVPRDDEKTPMPSSMPAPPPKPPVLSAVPSNKPSVAPPAASPIAAVARGPAPNTACLDRRSAVRAIQVAVAHELGLRGQPLSQISTFSAQAMDVAGRCAERLRSAGRLADSEDLSSLANDAGAQLVDFDPIIDLVEDEEVHEIVITHQREIFADRDGQLQPTGRSVTDEAEVVSLIERLAFLGGASDTPGPLVDTRLSDGARVVATLPPLAFRGPTLSYRKASREAFSLDDLVQHGALSDPMMRLLDYCVRYRKGVLLSVGPGVGASATLNALASIITADERIVTIERGVELHLGHQNVTALEPNGVSAGALIRHAAIMQPDRALIGVVDGDDAVEAMRAMRGSLEGAICGYCASSPADAVKRLLERDLVGESDAKALLASAVAVIIQEERFADGSRRVTRIAELCRDGDELSLEDVFAFETDGLDENGLVTGSFRATGFVPRFLEDLHERGLEVNLGLFQE